MQTLRHSNRNFCENVHPVCHTSLPQLQLEVEVLRRQSHSHSDAEFDELIFMNSTLLKQDKENRRTVCNEWSLSVRLLFFWHTQSVRKDCNPQSVFSFAVLTNRCKMQTNSARNYVFNWRKPKPGATSFKIV